MNKEITLEKYFEDEYIWDDMGDFRSSVEDKTLEEFLNTCHRGDWILWMFKRINPKSIRELTLAKGHCAATFLHLMKDDRSKKAVQAAVDFGEKIISADELKVFSEDADKVSNNNFIHRDSHAESKINRSVSKAASCASDINNCYPENAAKGFEGQIETADICRKYLPIEIWNDSKWENPPPTLSGSTIRVSEEDYNTIKASEKEAYKKKWKKHDPTDSLEVELDILVGTAKDIEESLEEFRKSLKRLERNIEKSNFLKSS